jgi:hypothetical protein
MLRREIIDLLPILLATAAGGVLVWPTFSSNQRGGKPHYAKNSFLHIIPLKCRSFGTYMRSFGFIAYQKRVYWLPKIQK